MSIRNRWTAGTTLITPWGQPIFAAIVSAAALGLFFSTQAPGYRGGTFLQIILISVSLLSVLLAVTETARIYRSVPRKSSAGSDVDQPIGLLPLFAISAGVVIVIGFAGIYVGSAILLFGYWVLVVGVRPFKALMLALVFGSLTPLVFSYLIGTRLWPGAMPTVIRNYVGGGILPPL
jgi:hypothetical protein